MPPIITDTSPASLAHCIEENVIACFSMWAVSPGSVREDDGITTIISGVPISEFNGVFRTQLPADLPPDQLDARITKTLRVLDQSGMPYGWHVFPSARPSALAEHLRAQGLQANDIPPGMAADLLALDESAPMPEGLVIEPVRDLATLRTWNQAAVDGFEMPQALEEPLYAAVSTFDLSADAPWQIYLGRMGGQPVATSMCLMAAGVAGFYTHSTVPEQRGQGIGAAMTLAPLRAARERGYRIGILDATEIGLPIYQRIGFRQYISIEHYERSEPAS